MSYQKWATVVIVVAAAIILGVEYVSVRWYPGHEQRVADAALKQLPYQNTGLGIQMEIASGIYGSVHDFAGGVKIYRSHLLGGGPAITITSAPNPDGASRFSDQRLAEIETAGTRNGLLGYQFQRLTLNGRDSYIVSQYDSHSRSTNVTAHVMAPDRVVQAVCNTGSKSEEVFTQACNESLNSMKVSGPPSKLPKPMGELD
ncbi:MAG: hypothetical protein ACRD18_04160 [Terriglobia bacterium]